jgi:hypothetical protein
MTALPRKAGLKSEKIHILYGLNPPEAEQTGKPDIAPC